jgi:hypothetical protein
MKKIFKESKHKRVLKSFFINIKIKLKNFTQIFLVGFFFLK